MTDVTDTDSPDPDGPSRTQQRREALAIFELAERLVALKPAELEALPIPQPVREQIAQAQAIRTHIAHKRQVQFLAKTMRREDEETLAAIRAQIEHSKGASRQETAILHLAENWRERLLAEGDEALAEWLQEYAHSDRQQLRQLVRNARDERAKAKPPRAQRELLRALRSTLGSA
jgi:ribosome-associated protein